MTEHERKLINDWLANYSIFVAYKDEFGCFPPARAVYKGVKIGSWWKHQKNSYRKGKMPEERQQLLTAAGYEFKDPIEYTEEFERKFALLLEYRDEFGCFPPARAVYKGVKIGVWLRCQIRAYQSGKLPEERQQLLTAAGYEFKDPIEYTEEFERKFALLLEYRDEFGCFPPAGEVYKNEKIGYWVSNLRKAYGRGLLSQERVDRLLAEGFVFSVREAEFERKFALLLEYKAEFGRLPAQRELYKDEALGNWWTKQKRAYQNGKMPKCRQKKFAKAKIKLN